MKKLIFLVILSFLMVFLTDRIGKVYNIYYNPVWHEYDNLAHLFGGAFSGTLGLLVCFLRKEKRYYFWAVGFSLIFGIGWEAAQYFSKSVWPVFDTCLDTILDTTGGWLAAFCYNNLK